MIWYEDLYVGYNLLDKKRKVIRKIKNRKPMFDTYVITLPRNDYDTLEIYPSNVLIQKWYHKPDMVVIGIAKGREEALDMMTLIIMECLEKTGNVNVKKYIMEQMN